MKKWILTVLAMSMFGMLSQVNAQVSVSVNISSQPLWGPVGYSHVEYYYLPQYEVYYSVPRAQFVYLDGGNWIFASALPPRFGTVNVYNTYKVVINQPTPYLYYKTHKVKYAKYKGGSYKQAVIRDSKESKYYVVKGHPNYGQAKKATPAPKASPAPRSSSASYKSSPQPKQYKSSPSPSYKSSGGSPSRGNSGHGGGNGGGNKGGGHGGGGKGGKK